MRAENNLGLRLQMAMGKIDPGAVSDGGFPLYDDYRAMAVANGVDPDDPVLAGCR